MNKQTKISKMKVLKKKNKRKRNKNIKTLFEKLRNESGISETSLNSSVISLDDSNTDSIAIGQYKRKQSLDTGNKRKKFKSDSVVIINDEDSIVKESCSLQSPAKLNESLCSRTPIKMSTVQCSTPIIKKDDTSLSKLIINMFGKNDSETKVDLNKEIMNLTKQINRDSYLTIDLTEGNDTECNKIPINTIDEGSDNAVIDLEDTTDLHECSIISVSKLETSQPSLSGESDVTVLHRPLRTNGSQTQRHGFGQLDPQEKGKLFDYVTETIFSGCNISRNTMMNLANIKTSLTSVKDEQKAISKILSRKSPSRNSVGSNVYHPERGNTIKSGLRMIIIDGSNVAMEHSKGRVFSVKGLKICIDYFLKRGHRVKAFVPRFRCKNGKSTDPRLLDWLQREGTVVYTPSREIKGKTITPYDDRYIIQCAAEFDGVIVTGDNYRDLIDENTKWRFVIENRLLPFTWVDDMIMFPKDPLGREGPTLEQFLKHNN